MLVILIKKFQQLLDLLTFIKSILLENTLCKIHKDETWVVGIRGVSDSKKEISAGTLSFDLYKINNC